MRLDTFFYKTPFWLSALYPHYLWRVKTSEKKVYLTFDDGPTPVVTDWVLETLSRYHAKATFFCLGKNVEQNPQIFQKILRWGHRVGNHSFQHENGWQTPLPLYLASVTEAHKHIQSKLFRPPYGKIKTAQALALQRMGFSIVMWDLVSGDFNPRLSAADSWRLVEKNIRPGSIVVFHDSQKAFGTLKEVLPQLLEKLNGEGYTCEALNLS